MALLSGTAVSSAAAQLQQFRFNSDLILFTKFQSEVSSWFWKANLLLSFMTGVDERKENWGEELAV